MPPRPRFSPHVEQVELKPPPGKKLGGMIAVDIAPNGDLFVDAESSVDPETWMAV